MAALPKSRASPQASRPLRRQPLRTTAPPASSRPAGSRSRGRPPVTPEVLRFRIDAYCKRYGVSVNNEGLPPFPAGQRETDRHREWMTLYKTHRRMSQRGPSTADLEHHHQLLTSQRGRCPVCRNPLDLDDSRLDQPKADGKPSPEPAVLHARCLELVNLARALGGDALDRARARL